MLSPLDYPFDVAAEPFVVRAGGVTTGVAPALPGGAVAPGPTTVTIVAAGSNASPTRLLAKLGPHLGGRAVAGTPCVVEGWTPVYSAHFAAYGAIPATLAPDPGARARLVCLLVPADLLDVLHRSEALGRNYGFYRMDGVTVRSETGIPHGTPHCYLSLHGVLRLDGRPRRLAAFGVEGSAFAPATEREAADAARALVAPELTLDELVERVRGDPAFRAQRTALLRERHAHPLGSDALRALA